jgi:hypothetical protein
LGGAQEAGSHCLIIWTSIQESKQSGGDFKVS